MKYQFPEDITDDKLHWLIENVNDMFPCQDDEDGESP